MPERSGKQAMTYIAETLDMIRRADLSRLPKEEAQVHRLHREGHLSGAEYDRLIKALEAQYAFCEALAEQERAVAIPAPKRAWTKFPPQRRRPKSRDKIASLQRRNELAAQTPLPPEFLKHFVGKPGQLAVLKIVGFELRRTGRCEVPLDQIAARAGVSRNTAKAALRMAVSLGLIEVQVRPVKGRKNDTNLIKLVSEKWEAWICYHHRGQSADHHGRQILRRGEKAAQPVSNYPAAPQRIGQYAHQRERDIWLRASESIRQHGKRGASQ